MDRKMKKISIIIYLLAVLLIDNCSITKSKEEDTKTEDLLFVALSLPTNVSCRESTYDLCLQARVPNYQSSTFCRENGYTASTTPCTDSTSGKCTYTAGIYTAVFFFTSTYTAQQARDICTSVSGTYSAN